MPVNGPSLRALNPLHRLDASPLVKGPEDSSLDGIQRRFAGVHNLHQNDGFRNAFHRVQPKASQVKEYVGKDLNKLATFKPENGIPVAKLRVSSQEPGEFISARRAAKNHSRVQAGYESLHRELQHLEPPPGQRQKGFLSAIRKLFGMDKPKAELDFKVERDHLPAAQAAAGQPHAEAAAGNPAAQAQPVAAAGKIKLTITSGDKQQLAQKAGEPVSFTAQDANLYESKVGRRKAAWLGAAGVGVGAGLALAFTVPVVGWVVGGAMIGGIFLKAAFGKSPWWGKTAEGQMQKSARQEARQAADAIAQMVKNQVLCDTTEHNLPAPEGGFLKQSVLSDKNMLTDFVALARQDNPKALSKRVKQFVMSENSPLPKEVRDLAGQNRLERGFKWIWPGNWFQGDPKGHARKTVALMTQEIARGIMQGVQEGVLQSVVLDLSNELSNAAREELYKVPLPRIEQFQKAVAKLYPSANENRHPIYKADETLSDLKAFQKGSTRLLLQQLQDKAGTIGEENVNSYSELLRKLDGDISTHIASMEQIQALLGPPEGLEDPPVNTLANLQSQLAKIATGQLNGKEINTAKAAIDDQIANLRQRIRSADDPGTDKLVQSHAQQLLSLLDAMDQAAEQSVKAARQLADIRADFSQGEPAPTMAMVRTHQASLKILSENDIDPNQGNPTGSDAVVQSQAQGLAEAVRLENLCSELTKAGDAADAVRQTMESSLGQARQGHLKQALASEVLRGLDDQRFAQRLPLSQWQQAGFAKPGDLKAYGDADIDALRSQACALAIGLNDAQAGDLQPVLLALSKGDQAEVIAGLRNESSRDKDALLDSLRELQGLLGQPGDGAAYAQTKALRSFKALTDQRLFNGSLELCQEVVQSLHPAHLNLLNQYQAVHAIDKNLRELFTGDRGEKLYAWGAKKDLVQPNERDDFGFDPKRTLELLQAFNAQRPAPLATAAASLKTLAQAWPAQEKVEDWSLDPGRLQTLSDEDLDRVQGLVKGVAKNFDTHVQEERVKALALARQKARQIVEGGQGSSDPKVRAAVIEASSAKDPAQVQQLQQHAQDLQLMLGEQADAERQQRLDAGQIAKLSTFLKEKLGYRGSAEQLAQRIYKNPELSAEFMLLMDTGVKLAGSEAPPLLQPIFTREQLLAGADELASYVPHKHVNTLRPALQPMVEQRNAMIAKIKAAPAGEARANLLAKDPKVRAYLESFLNEEYAYQLLAGNEKLMKSKKEVRIILDDTADPLERSQLGVEMTRNATLTTPNLKKIQDGLINGLKRQEEALTALHEGAQQQYGEAMSSYMQDQMGLLAAQKQAAQRLPQAYLDPHTGDLAQMGQLLRQADGLKDKSQIQIQRAYIKGQNQASQDALKYFDIRRFDAKRPGIFGRLIFSIMRRGQPLSRLLRSATDEKNALARAFTDLIRARVSQQISTEQVKLFENRIRELQAAKDAITGNPQKVKDALFMLAGEHLAGKQGKNPKITEADLQTILGQWKSMLAGATQDCFPEVEEQAKAELLDKGAIDIEESLGEQDKAQLALELGQLMKQQDALVAEHQEIRAQLNKIDLQTNQAKPEVLRLYQAGLDLSDQQAVTALEGSLSTLADGSVNLLKGWIDAGALLATDPATALHRAGRELRVLERTLENPGKLSLEMQKQLRLLKDQLEDAFLARMGPGAPMRLERLADAKDVTLIARNASKLKSAIDQFPDGKSLEAWIKGAGQSKQVSVSQFLSELQNLDLALRDQLVQHSVEQLQAVQPPRSLTALAQLAAARLDIGLIYSRLSAVQGDLSSDPNLHTEVSDKSAMRSKADSHLYGGLFMQQELGNKKNAWSPDPNKTTISGLPSDAQTIKALRQTCEKASGQIPKGQPLTAAQADALDHAAEGRLDMGMMQSHIENSMDMSIDEDNSPRNRQMFNAIIMP